MATKTKRRATDRYVEFRCGHRGYVPDGSAPNWKTTACPICGKPGITTEQASVYLHHRLNAAFFGE